MYLIKKYFPELTNDQIKKFENLIALYNEWNKKINVVSRKDMDNFEERHLLHSLAIAKIIYFKAETKILDAGTGGGLPGIPLAIFFPDVQFHLLDSVGKKIKVVKEISNELNLQNLSASQERMENHEKKYHFITARAVTNLSKLYHWVKKNIEINSFNDITNGLLCFKGGDLTEELTPFKKKGKVYELKNYFEEDFYKTKKIVWLGVNQK